MPCRILIADDHSIVRKTVRAMLEAHPGWAVCAEAANGIEAAQKTAELQPDVVVLDLSMPLMDGLESARRILSSFPNLPVLLFTNHMYSALDTEARKIGIRGVVSKQSDGLITAVEAVLDKKLRAAMDALQADGHSGQSAECSNAKGK